MLGEISTSTATLRGRSGISGATLDCCFSGSSGRPLHANSMTSKQPNINAWASRLPRPVGGPTPNCSSRASAIADPSSTAASGQPSSRLRGDLFWDGSGLSGCSLRCGSGSSFAGVRSRSRSRSISGTKTGQAARSLHGSAFSVTAASAVVRSDGETACGSDNGNPEITTRPRPTCDSINSGRPAGNARASTLPFAVDLPSRPDPAISKSSAHAITLGPGKGLHANVDPLPLAAPLLATAASASDESTSMRLPSHMAVPSIEMPTSDSSHWESCLESTEARVVGPTSTSSDAPCSTASDNLAASSVVGITPSQRMKTSPARSVAVPARL